MSLHSSSYATRQRSLRTASLTFLPKVQSLSLATTNWGSPISSPQGTIENLRHNPAIELNVVDPFTRPGFRFKGRAEIVKTDAEAHRRIAQIVGPERFEPINPIAWMVGHLAWQEQLYWPQRAQGVTVEREVHRFGYSKPLTVPPLDEAWAWWRAITKAADPYLDALTVADLERPWRPEPRRAERPGTKLHRTTYHYWFHLGESHAVRQLLGHTKLPDFVGSFRDHQYRPEGRDGVGRRTLR